MSEYQYYEFRAIDAPLSETQRAEVAGLSSRSQVTSMSATFVYNYGSFRGNVTKIMAKYFDAMIYMANWGTKRLIFRIPTELVNITQFQPYCQSEEVNVEKIDNALITIDFNFHEEDGYGWLEGEGWLDSLLTLRDSLIQGDLRVLYLAWLKTIQEPSYGVKIDENALEPIVPPGLGALSSALKSFVEFYEIDASLIAAAAKNSDKLAKQDVELTRWIAKLPIKEQQDFLSRLSRSEKNLSILLNRRLHELANIAQPVEDSSPTRRTIGDLFVSAEKWRKQKETATKRKSEQKQIQALQAIADNQQKMWRQIDALIERKLPKTYDQAITLLIELRDLAEYQNNLDAFSQRVNKIRQTYSRRSSLISRLRAAKLLVE